MAREEIKMMMDLSDRECKRRLQVSIATMQGLYEISIVPRRATITTEQRGYYFGVVLECVRLGIKEAWGEDTTIDECHIGMKAMFLSKPIVNRETGEVQMMTSASIAGLDVMQMAEYIDKIIKFAAEMLNVPVPPPDKHWKEPINHNPKGGATDV